LGRKGQARVHASPLIQRKRFTVQAGTFVCFKITDSVGASVSTRWYSDKVKNYVKEIAADGSARKLKFYSV
jgi:hypothetical protein